MKTRIIEEIKRVEQKYGIEVLYACETGSRAWGFPSPDSDYDVRMIYKHSLDWYLTLSEKKDNIEYMSEDKEIDLTGWDIRKSLKLLFKSNASLLERIQSPIVYAQKEGFVSDYLNYAIQCYSPISTLYHYLKLAENSFEEVSVLKEYRLKRMFYALRGAVACKWIMSRNEMPPILFTKRETAELIKYAANSFLATKITFINEIADLCEKVGANVSDVSTGIGLDGRIGKKFLHPGPGYGGSCFPKDTLALVKTAQDYKSPLTLIEHVVESNKKRKRSMYKRITKILPRDKKKKTISVLGLTFKPNTDDMRDSPSLDIIPALIKQNYEVRVFDPEGMEEAKKSLIKYKSKIIWCKNAYEAALNADVLVILTEWNEFRALDLKKLKKLLKRNVIVDLRNIYNPIEIRENGFEYYSVGRVSL